MAGGLDTGFILDRRWHALRGEMEQSKKPALLLLGRILAEAKLPYAIIGGVALQVHQEEPRTTLDIDLAVADRAAIPREALRKAGFIEKGRHGNSENWLGPEATPVQFTDDPALAGGIARAEKVMLEDVELRVLAAVDLLHAKLRAVADPARRRSKRLQDLADAQALLERQPSMGSALSPEEAALLDALPR